jgi:hypothetical protein
VAAFRNERAVFGGLEGLSQEQLAYDAGVSRAHVGGLEIALTLLGAALKHISADVSDARTNHAEGARGSDAEIENAAAIEWAAIVYRDDDAATSPHVRDAKTCAKRQSLVSRCEPGAAARIVGRHPEECARRGLSRMRMHWCGRNDRGQDDDCPTMHMKTRRFD